MSDSIDMAMKEVDRRNNTERRQKLFEIIRMILDNEIDSSKTPLAGIFNQSGPRQTYVSPKDRASYDSGEMQMGDLAGTNYYE